MDKSGITKKLADIENEENIKILLAVESGSRAWGFESPDSDFDIRGVYMRKPEWYLRVDQQKDTLERMDGLFDLSLWDLPKSLALLKNSNAALIEWFSSPIVYMVNEEFKSRFLDLVDLVSQPKPMIFHYLSIAEGNYRDYIKGKRDIKLKKYFYVLRAIFAARVVIETQSRPPIEFDELRAQVTLPKDIEALILEFLVQKAITNEKLLHKPSPFLNNYIEGELQEIQGIAENIKAHKSISYQELNTYFRETLQLWS